MSWLKVYLLPLFSLTRVRRETFARTALVFAAIAAVLANVNWTYGASLSSAAAPYGIFSLELAGDPFVARTIVQTWTTDQGLHAAFLIGMRVFIGLCAGTALVAACLWQMSDVPRVMRAAASLGRWVVWVQVAGGILELATDAMLISQVIDRHHEQLALITMYAAVTKYAFAVAGVSYIAGMEVLRQVNAIVEAPSVRSSR